MLKLTPLETDDFTWLFLEARRGKPDRSVIQSMQYPPVAGSKGLVISPGKLSGWTYAGALSHYRNLTCWQAIYDPSEKGAIVIGSFDHDYPVGYFLELNLPCLTCAKEGRETLLKSGAMYPYCQQFNHQNHAPERQSYQPKRARG